MKNFSAYFNGVALGKGVRFGFLFFILTAGSLSYADQYFQPNRQDRTVPGHCYELDIADFDEPFENVTVGILGATSKSFSLEVPISRGQAELLWRVFRARAQGRVDSGAESQLQRDASIHDEAQIINFYYQPMGFSFNSEGDVLELLSIVYMKGVYPEGEYFHTGGYNYGSRGRVVGELDIVIGRTADCQIVLVGQAKLGLGSSGNAWEQIERFKHFVGALVPNIYFR